MPAFILYLLKVRCLSAFSSMVIDPFCHQGAAYVLTSRPATRGFGVCRPSLNLLGSSVSTLFGTIFEPTNLLNFHSTYILYILYSIIYAYIYILYLHVISLLRSHMYNLAISLLTCIMFLLLHYSTLLTFMYIYHVSIITLFTLLYFYVTM